STLGRGPISSSRGQTTLSGGLSRAPTLGQAVHSAASGPAEASKPRRIEALSADRYGVHFTADGEFCAVLERVRGLAGHRLPSGDLMTLLKRGLEAYERELEKERFAVGRKVRRSREATPGAGGAEPAEAKQTAPRPVPPKLSEPESDKTAVPNSAPSIERLPISSWKRRYTAEVMRAVFLRDGKQCSYVSLDGRRCRARRCLELDHIEPVAVGGE